MSKSTRKGGTKQATSVDDTGADPIATVVLTGEHACKPANHSWREPRYEPANIRSAPNS